MDCRGEVMSDVEMLKAVAMMLSLVLALGAVVSMDSIGELMDTQFGEATRFVAFLVGR